MSSKPLIVALILISLALSGCTQRSDQSDGAAGSGGTGGTGGGARAPGEPNVPNGTAIVQYRVDCAIAIQPDWPEKCLARASITPESKTEYDLMVNPKDPNNVIIGTKDLDRNASGCVWSVPLVTKDGGKTWQTVYIGGKNGTRQPTDPLYGWQCITDPIMAFDGDGIAYYALQAYDYSTLKGVPDQPESPVPPPVEPPVPTCGRHDGSAFYLAISSDGGLTWPRILTMDAGDAGCVFHDYPRMTWNPMTGSVYATWNAITPEGSVAVVSGTRDSGMTVDPPTHVASTNPDLRGKLGITGFTAANDGTVYLALTDGGDVYLSTSTDDAKTFSEPRKIFNMTPIDSPLPNTRFRAFSAIELAVDRSGGASQGTLYAVWADNRTGDSDIMASVSKDKGASWSAPMRVNEYSKNYQFMVRPTVSADGVLHIVYMDRSYDAGDRLLDATYAY
jgi:hypothetical protein